MLFITDCYRPRLSPLMLLVQVGAAAQRGTAAAQALQCSCFTCLGFCITSLILNHMFDTAGTS